MVFQIKFPPILQRDFGELTDKEKFRMIERLKSESQRYYKECVYEIFDNEDFSKLGDNDISWELVNNALSFLGDNNKELMLSVDENKFAIADKNNKEQIVLSNQIGGETVDTIQEPINISESYKSRTSFTDKIQRAFIETQERIILYTNNMFLKDVHGLVGQKHNKGGKR